MEIHHNIILVNVLAPENLGFCARAMKSMGLHRLILVGNKPLPLSRAFLTAVHAQDILENMRVVDRLEEALQEDHVPVAFAGKSYGQRSKRVFDLEEWADHASQIGAGMDLVFGSERHGLGQHEVERCDWIVTIPTHPDQPSLNLSHAVQLAAYALFRRGQSSKDDIVPATTLKSWARELIGFAQELGQFPYRGSAQAERLVRSLLYRMAPSRWEGDWLIKQAQTFKALVRRARGPQEFS